MTPISTCCGFIPSGWPDGESDLCSDCKEHAVFFDQDAVQRLPFTEDDPKIVYPPEALYINDEKDSLLRRLKIYAGWSSRMKLCLYVNHIHLDTAKDDAERLRHIADTLERAVDSY